MVLKFILDQKIQIIENFSVFNLHNFFAKVLLWKLR